MATIDLEQLSGCSPPTPLQGKLYTIRSSGRWNGQRWAGEQQFGNTIIRREEPDWRVVKTQDRKTPGRSKDLRACSTSWASSIRMVAGHGRRSGPDQGFHHGLGSPCITARRMMTTIRRLDQYPDQSARSSLVIPESNSHGTPGKFEITQVIHERYSDCRRDSLPQGDEGRRSPGSYRRRIQESSPDDMQRLLANRECRRQRQHRRSELNQRVGIEQSPVCRRCRNCCSLRAGSRHPHWRKHGGRKCRRRITSRRDLTEQ